MAWMNEDTLRQTLDEGRTVFWSRSRQEEWRKGETSGDRQFVREAYYDCDGDTLLFVVEQEGKGACHTGDRTCFFRAFGGRPRRGDPARAGTTFRALARDHTVVPVWREVLADLDHAGRRLRPAVRGRRARLPARVGRARRALGPLVVRRPRPVGHARRPRAAASRSTAHAARRRSRSTGACWPPSRRCSAAYRSPRAPRPAAAARRARRLPRLRRGARGRAPARRPPDDDLGLPDAVLSVIGELAAFDHWRQRVTLIANALRARRRRPTPSSTRAYDEAVARLEQLAADGARPLDEPLVDPPDPDEPLPEVRSTMGGRPLRGGGRGRQGAHPRRRHLPGRAGPAVRPRPRRRPVRRLPGAAPGEPEPVHVLPAPPRGDPGRLVARADGAAARRPGRSPGPSPAPATGAAPTRRTAASAPSCASTPRSSPST